MAVMMFEVRAFGFQDIIILVLDFPTGASGLHDGFHAGTIQGMIGRKRMAIQDGSLGLFGDGEFTPIASSRVFSLAQRDTGGIPIGVHLTKATIPAADVQWLEISRRC
jgi:hypothetical protein